MFGPKTGIPTLAAARMQRWALMLSGYDYDICYRSSQENVNADMLSRLPLATQNEGEGYGAICKVTELDLKDNYEFCHVIETLPMTSRDIAKHTSRDPVLGKVYEYTASGWPGHCQEEIIQPYWNRRHELSVEDGCLLWGRRVIVPSALQERLITDLHECHPGMSRMKALARGFVWWPGLDADIEDKVRACEVCSSSQMTPQLAPLIFWPWSTEPWERIHIDFAEIKGQQFLLVVDSHSKWLEVFPMDSTTASVTVTAIRSLFSRYGLPVEVVTDNGPQFISEEFGTFLKLNGVKHTLCPVYHPSSNGLAEKHVQTFKRMFTKSQSNLSLQHKVADVLFRYRNTPHTSTGHTPAELFLKRTPRTHLSLLKPSLQRKVEQRQTVTKQHRDGQKPKMRVYDLYQKVKVRNMRGGKEKWLPAVVVKIKGPLTYVVRLAGNRRRFVHADHLMPDDTRENGGLGDRTDPEGSGRNLSVIPPALGDCSPTTEPLALCGPVEYPQKVSSPTTELPSPARSGSNVECYPATPGRSPDSHVNVSEGVIQLPRVSRSGRIIQAPRKLDL